MDSMSPHAGESLVRIWTALHAGFRPALTATDAAYLQRVLLDLDDDLLVQLLAAKLASAMRFPLDDGTTLAARTGACVRFTVDGQAAQATLAHGRVEQVGVLGTASRYGTAVFGLRPGDAILWPRADRRLVEVRVLDVTPDERPGLHAAPTPTAQGGLACASG